MINVYIDMANLNIETKKQSIDIDYFKFYKYLRNKYKPDNIYIFTGYLKQKASEYKKISEYGFIYKFKAAVYDNAENRVKANCDVDIAIEGTIDVIEKGLNKSIIITSDGDFISLIKLWRQRKVEVVVISPAPAYKCSYLLKKDNQRIVFIEQIKSLFEMKKPSM